jgi:hypothetical protein
MYYLYTNNDQKALASTTTLMGLAQTTLGNLGGSDVACQSKRLFSQSLTVTCATGQIQWQDAVFGVMSSQVPQKIYCTEEAIWEAVDSSTTNCTALLD